MKLVTTLVIIGLAVSMGSASANHGPEGGREGFSLLHYDTNRDGTISAAELAAANAALVASLQSRLFDKYDTNKDGTISTAEALAVNQAAAEEWVQDILEDYDANSDGALSADELQSGRGFEALVLLDAYDQDNDGGALSAAELDAAAQAVANRLQKRLLDKYDSNKDGSITTAEALAVHQAI